MNLLLKIGLLSVLLSLFACVTKQPEMQHYPIVDKRYDSEFPVQSVSDELAYLSTTVRKLDCLAFYMTYTFPPEYSHDKSQLDEVTLNASAISVDVHNESVSGTATIIYYDNNQVGLLTCAHVIDFPDTLYNYDEGGKLQSVSVKIKQQNFVSFLPDGEDVEILAMDKKHDIALLGKKLNAHDQIPAVLKYPIGKTRDIDWGTVVYTMGYPLGKLMVTRSIASKPSKDGNGMFLTDALFNHGISGSPVLALRDGVPNFEWVGMASSSAAESIYYLKPGGNTPQFVSPNSAYSGELIIDRRKAINYGVTFSVRIEDIVKFLSQNKKLLQEEGFNTDLFFK